MGLPVNFETLAKSPPAVNGGGYPYRISARDLMRNFSYAAVELAATTPGGNANALKMYTETGEGGHLVRMLYVEPCTCADTTLPAPP